MRIASLSLCCAAALLACVGCESGHQSSTATTTSRPAARSRLTRDRVVDFIISPRPEGPTLNRRLLRGHWRELVARLPKQLPQPLPQPRCAFGSALILKLGDGSQLNYECKLPPDMRAVRQYAIHLSDER